MTWVSVLHEVEEVLARDMPRTAVRISRLLSTPTGPLAVVCDPGWGIHRARATHLSPRPTPRTPISESKSDPGVTVGTPISESESDPGVTLGTPISESASQDGGMADYRTEHARSIEDPEGYWAEQAKLVDWIKQPRRILDDDHPAVLPVVPRRDPEHLLQRARPARGPRQR